MRYLTIVQLAEMALENSKIRHGNRLFDFAQSRFVFLLREIESKDPLKIKSSGGILNHGIQAQ
jgi:hypothetical protein